MTLLLVFRDSPKTDLMWCADDPLDSFMLGLTSDMSVRYCVLAVSGFPGFWLFLP